MDAGVKAFNQQPDASTGPAIPTDTSDCRAMDVTDIGVRMQEMFSSADDWLFKGGHGDTSNGATLYLPHLKGFDFKEDGTQKLQSEITESEWPVKRTVKASWADPDMAAEYTGEDLTEGPAAPIIASPEIPGCPDGSERAFYKEENGAWVLIEETPSLPGKYKAVVTTGTDSSEYIFSITNRNGYALQASKQVSSSWESVSEIKELGVYSGRLDLDNGAVMYLPQFTVTRRDITVTADNKTKVYGTDDPEFTATVARSVSGEPAEYTFTREPGEGVGQYVITPSGDETQGNYTVGYSTGLLTITAYEPTIRIEIPDTAIVYDGSAHTPQVTVYDAVTGTLIPAGEYSVSYSDNVNAGTATITVTDGTGVNYVVNGTRTFTIERAPVTVRADDSSKTYGHSDPVFTATVTGLQGGDTQYVLSWDIARAAGENAGTYSITPSGDAEQGNYTVTYTPGTFTIIRKLTGMDEAPAVISGLGYEGTWQSLVSAGTAEEGGTVRYALGNADTAPGLDPAGTAEADRTWKAEAPMGKDAGIYHVWYMVEADSNHSTTGGPECLNVTITTAPVTVKADDKTAVYGSAIPNLTATVTGLKGNDSLLCIGYALNREAGVSAGTYVITPSGDTEQGNYTVTYTTGTLTISPKAATIRIEIPDTAIVYDGTAHTPQVTVYDAVTGDEIPEAEYTVSYSNNINAGTAATITISDVANGNYNISGSRTFTIQKAPVTVTAVSVSKEYGSADPVFIATVAGTYGTDTVLYTLSRAEGEAASTYEITPSGDTEQGNYAVTYIPGTLTISPKAATIRIEIPDTAIVYDSTAHTPQVTVYDAVTEDLISSSEYSVGYSNNVNAGTATITVTDVTGGNYSVSGTRTFAIQKAPVTVTADNKAKMYGADDPIFTATVSGTYGTDTVLYTLSRAEGEAASTYEITPSGDAVQGNYTVTYIPGTLTISPRDASVTISIPDTAITYDGTAHEPAVTVYDASTGIEIPSSEYSVGYIDNVNAGTATIIISDVAGGSYSVSGSRTFEIGKAPVTIKADDCSKTYGHGDPVFTVTVTGLKGNDTQYALNWDIARADGENAGTYLITPNGETEQGNYTVTYESGTFTIIKKLTGMSEAPSVIPGLTYDGSWQALVSAGTAEEGGTIRYALGGTEAAPALDPNGTAETNRIWKAEAPAGKNAGTYHVWYMVETDGNHTVTDDPECLDVTIARADVTVKADDKSSMYGDEYQELTATVTGLKGTDSISAITYGLSRDEGDAAGTYSITAYGEAVQGNYRVSYESGTYTIEKIPIRISAPTVKSITINGDAYVELVAPPNVVVSGSAITLSSTVLYAVTTEPGVQPAASEFVPTTPKVKDGGTYYVWYMIDGGANIESTAPACMTVEVEVSSGEPDIQGGGDDQGSGEAAGGSGTGESTLDPVTPPDDSEGTEGASSGNDENGSGESTSGENVPDISGGTSGTEEIPGDADETAGGSGEATDEPGEAEEDPAEPAEDPAEPDPTQEYAYDYTDPEPWYGTRTIHYTRDTKSGTTDITETYTRLRTGYEMAKVVKVFPDGAKTLDFDEIQADGKHTVKTSSTKPDGTKDLKETVKDKSGKLLKETIQKVRISKTGTKTDTRTEIRSDGYSSVVKKKTYWSGTITVDSTVAETDGTKRHSVSRKRAADGRFTSTTLFEYKNGLPVLSFDFDSPTTGYLKKNYSIKKDGTLRLENIITDKSYVTIPATESFDGKKYEVTSVAAWAVSNIPSLTRVNIMADNLYIGRGAFSENENLKDIWFRVPRVRKVKPEAFDGIAEDAVVHVSANKKQFRKFEKKLKASDFDEDSMSIVPEK